MLLFDNDQSNIPSEHRELMNKYIVHVHVCHVEFRSNNHVAIRIWFVGFFPRKESCAA